MENNDENSGPLSSLPADRLTATDCKADRSCQYSHQIKFLVQTVVAEKCRVPKLSELQPNHNSTLGKQRHLGQSPLAGTSKRPG